MSQKYLFWAMSLGRAIRDAQRRISREMVGLLNKTRRPRGGD
jgi:hypothetical protein